MLTEAKARNAKPGLKPAKLPDSGGLYLHVTPAGGRHWRMRYKIGGKEQTLSMGPYPAVTLAAARDGRDAAKALLRVGRDPAGGKRLEKLSNAANTALTFEAVARRWYDQAAPTWTPIHASDVIGSLERDVFPAIGGLPIRDLTAPVILNVLRQIEARRAIETARRIRQRISAVFAFGIATGITDGDPAAVVKGAMAPLVKGRQPAIIDLADARAMLGQAEATAAHPLTKLALRMLALTSVRPGELRAAAWDEFEDLDGPAPVWRLSAERMKMKRAHAVPLSRQAVEVLAAARSMSGRGPMVFPNGRRAHRPMSENAIGYLLNRAGYAGRHVPHGWRATFSSAMNERYPADRYILDLMLAHAPKDRVEAAYNRATHMERRRELAQLWADLLLEGAAAADTLKAGLRRFQA